MPNAHTSLLRAPVALTVEGESFVLASTQSEIPRGLFELRQQVYGEEMAFLPQDQLILPEDHTAHHVIFYHEDQAVAAMVGMPADRSPFHDMTQMPMSSVMGRYFSSKGMVLPAYRSRFALWPLLTYLTFLHGRSIGCEDNLSLFENKNFVELLMDVEWLTHLPRVFYEGHDKPYELFPARVGLAYGMEQCWDVLTEDIRDQLHEQGLVLAGDTVEPVPA